MPSGKLCPVANSAMTDFDSQELTLPRCLTLSIVLDRPRTHALWFSLLKSRLSIKSLLFLLFVKACDQHYFYSLSKPGTNTCFMDSFLVVPTMLDCDCYTVIYFNRLSQNND